MTSIGNAELVSTIADVTTAAGTLLLSLIAARFARSDLQIRRAELDERRARAGAALNIEVVPSVHRCGEMTLLRSRVIVANHGTEIWCLPAVYVSLRTIRPEAVGSVATQFYRGRADALPEADVVGAPRNVVLLPGSIYQLLPDESVTFDRFDLLDSAFVEQNPVLVLIVEGFGAPGRYLGFQGATFGIHRRAWLEFVNDVARHTGPGGPDPHMYVMFDRTRTRVLDKDGDVAVEQGGRVLLMPDGKTVDVEHSRKFRDMLDDVMQWSRSGVIELRPPNP